MVSKKKANTANKALVPAKTNMFTPTQASKNWDAAVNDLKARKANMSLSVVQFHYDLGLLCVDIGDALTQELRKRRYGDHVIKDLATALDISESSVYGSMKFAQMFSLEELARLKAKKWPWRQIQQLLSVEDPGERTKFQNEYESGLFPRGNALRDAVVDRNKDLRASGVRKDKRGQRSGFMEAAKTAAAIVTHTTGEILPTFIKALKDYGEQSEELDDSKQEQFTEFAQQVKQILPATKRIIDDVVAALKLAGM